MSNYNVWNFASDHPFISLLMVNTVCGMVKYGMYVAGCRAGKDIEPPFYVGIEKEDDEEEDEDDVDEMEESEDIGSVD